MSLTVKIKGDASQFDKTMRGVKASVGGLSSKIGAIGAAAAGAAAGYVTLSKAMEFLQSSSQKAAGMEDLQMSLVTLTGSASGAKKTLKELSDIADKSTFGVDVYADAAKLLIGFGVSADDAIPVLRNLADISMGNQEKFGGLALAFGQAAAGGRLMKEEVNQMIERGFNPLQIIAQRTGESMGDLLKRVSAGGVSIDELKKSMADATGEGGRFNNAMNNAMDTTNGKISMVEKSINKLQIAFGTGFNDGLKEALKSANNFIPQLQEKFTNAGEFMGAAMTESLTGNTKKFELIGQLIGELVIAGIEAAVILSLDKLGARLGGGLANMIEADKYSWLGVMDKISGGKIAENVRSGTASATSFGEQFRGAMQSTGVQGTLQEIEIQRQISEGVKTGINTSMSREVREGVLEAWSRQSQQATFSN